MANQKKAPGQEETLDQMVRRTNAQPRTNAEGQFVTGNQNPYPVPQEVRGGTQKEIDTRTGKEKTEEQKQQEVRDFENRVKEANK